ncbi:MAG: discoidin domain-containing protein, partial [Chthoniobacterales bacterium]
MNLRHISTFLAASFVISAPLLAQTNVAQGKTATASSVQGTSVAANANDGVATGTRWTAVDGTFPQWWKVDLGSSYSLTSATINWYSTTSRAYKYKIEVSADDATYNTVVDKTGNVTFGDTTDPFSATGRYVRVTVTGANAGFASAYEISVFGTPAGAAPVITSSLTASGTAGTAFSYQIMATNSPTSFSAPSLPAGLSINTATGLISGTPTTAAASTNYAITATNGSGSDTKQLAITINAASGGGTNLALNQPQTSSSVNGTDTAAKGNDGATGTRWTGVTPYPQWWRVDLGSAKTFTRVDIMWYSPTSRAYKYKLEVSANDATYNTIVDQTANTVNGNSSDVFASTTARYVRVTVTGSSSGGNASFYELGVYDGGTSGASPVITSATTVTAQEDVSFAYQMTATNSPTSFGATSLPPGLHIDAPSGLISGTPTTPGTYNSPITATNANGTGTATLHFTVSAAPTLAPVVTSPLDASGTVGVPFTYQIVGTNSPTNYNATGALPAGLDCNTVTGIISGTPTSVTTANVEARASNSSGTGAAMLVIDIGPATPTVPSINSTLTKAGNVGAPLGYQITASFKPTSFSATGLPAWLTLDTTTGYISGTPTATGSTTVS